MTKPKPPSQLETTKKPTIPRNAVDRRHARESGCITGWLKNRKRGAPLKIKPPNKKLKGKASPITSAAASTVSAAATTRATAASTTMAKAGTKPPASTAPSRKYISWKTEPGKSALVRAVEAKLKGLDPQLAAGVIVIPRQTLDKHIRYAKQAAKKMGGLDTLYLKDFTRKEENCMLTTELDRVYLQELIALRDLRNNGMTRREVIHLIQQLTGATFEKAEQHWYYCRRSKLFPELKGHGALRSAQGTTTKRSGVTTEKLLRWHGTVDETLRELDRRNSWHPDWDGIRISSQIDSFWGNMDETCMSAADGKFLYQCVHLCLHSTCGAILTASLNSCPFFLAGFTKVVASKYVKNIR